MAKSVQYEQAGLMCIDLQHAKHLQALCHVLNINVSLQKSFLLILIKYFLRLQCIYFSYFEY